MRRFNLPGLLFLISIATVPSCAHLEGRELSVERPEATVPSGELTAERRDAPRRSTAGSASDSGPVVLQTGSEEFTIEQLEELAMEYNPSLRQAAAVVNKAYGIRRQVGLYPNPVIGYSGDEIGNDGASGQQGGFISQTIVTGDKLRLNRAVAGHDVQALSWELEAQRYRVQTDVRVRFYETLGAQRRVRLARQLMTIALDGANAARELLNAQQGTRPDLLQAEVQLNQVRIILQNAEFDYEAAWKQLASLVGRPDLTPTHLQGTLDGESPGRDWDETFEQLLATSPELQAAGARVNRARTAIRRQRVQPIPNLLTAVGVAHDNASGDDITSVELGIPLPLFNRNQGNIDIATAEYHRAVQDVERLELSLRVRLAAAFRNYNQARTQVERYRRDILPKVKENLDLTNEGYKKGEFDFLRALIARRSYFETNLAFVRALVALRQSDVVISGLLLTGGLNDVPDISGGAGGVGNRDQALGGQ